jgi:hypothetical protein
MVGWTGCICYLRRWTNLMLDFRTVTYHTASRSLISHPVSVRNAGGVGGGGLTSFKHLMLCRMVSGKLFSLYSDIRKKNPNAMTRKCTAVASRV